MLRRDWLPRPALVGSRLAGVALIGEAEATSLARAHDMDCCRLKPYGSSGPFCGHNASKFFFFAVVRTADHVGGDEIIAVRNTDGQLLHCGTVGK